MSRPSRSSILFCSFFFFFNKEKQSVIPSDRPLDPPVTVKKRTPGLMYTVDHVNGSWLGFCSLVFLHNPTIERMIFANNALYKSDSIHGEWMEVFKNEDVVISDIDCFEVCLFCSFVVVSQVVSRIVLSCLDM
jgi:hypothetical protein